MVIAAAMATLGGSAAMAASQWTGGATVAAPASNTWNTANNWSPTGVPTSSATTELDFLGSTTYTATDNISGVFNLNILKVNGNNSAIAASAGDSLNFTGTNPVFNQSAASIFTVSAPVSLGASTTINQIAGSEIDLTGNVTGTGSLTLSNSGASSSTVRLSGANSFAGLIVNPNVTAVSALSSNSTSLGSSTVTLAGGKLALQGQLSAAGGAVETQVGLTGFNGDTIADAASTSNTVSSNGTPYLGVDPSHLYFQNGFEGNTGGLPANGQVVSTYNGSAAALNKAKTTFYLGYNGSSISLANNNALYFQSGTTAAEALALATPSKATTLQFLASAQNVSSFDVQLNFSNGTTSTYAAAVTTGVWATFGSSGNNVANQAALFPNVLTYNGGLQNWVGQLSESDITLNAADQAKTISSIAFIPDSTGYGNSAEIYAVSGDIVSGTQQQLSIQSYANNLSVTANSSIDVSGSLSAIMGNLSIGAKQLSVTSADSSGSPYSLALGSVTLTGSVGSGTTGFNVAASSGGGAGTLSLGALNDGGIAQSISINPASGTGTVVLTTNATDLATGTLINIQSGTLNSSTGSAIGSTATVNLASAGTLFLGASQTISALNGSGGSVSLGANSLTVGSTDNLSSTFGGTISGSGVLIKAGSGTVTLSGSSTFTGSSVNTSGMGGNGANLPASTIINYGTVVVNGSSNVSNGLIASSPLGTSGVLVNSGTSLMLGTTPGLIVANPLYGTSSGANPSTFGGLNTTGVSTFSGSVTLGSGSSGDTSHSAIVGASAGGEVDFTGNILENVAGNASPITVNNLTGSGSATVRFTGNNTYGGGTTINPNVTLAIGPSTYSTGLGTGTVTLAGGKLALQGLLPSGSQQIVPVSGFNVNTILDAAASGGTQTSTGTPTSSIGTGLVYFQNGYQGNTTNGLPANGTITSALTGHQFQIATYTGLNALQFTSPGSQTLTLATPGAFSKLDFLAVSQGTSAYTVTLNFGDSTSATVGGFATADWYGGSASTNAVTGLDPAQQDVGGVPSQTIYTNYGGALTMGEYDVSIPAADQGKTIDSVTLNATAVNGNSTNIYAISGATAAGTAPLANQSYANNINVTADSGIDVSGSLNASIGTITMGNVTLSISSSDASGSPYTLTAGQITFAATPPTIGVANSSGGGLGTLILGSINDNGAAQQFTKTGPGTLVFSAPATQIGDGSNYNVAGGTLASNDPNALSYNNGSTTLYVGIAVAPTATFSIGADQQISKLNDMGTPVVNGSNVILNGHTLTIGSVNDYNSTFSGVISDGTGGSGSLAKSGAGTLRLNGASTYSGNTYVGFGTLLVANTTGSATGTSTVTTANTSNATLASGTVGTIAGNVVAGQLSYIQPGGNGSIGTLTVGGLTTGFNTDINFDLGTGTGIVTNGDLLNIGSGTTSIAPDTLITFTTNPTTTGVDYRLIGGAGVGSVTLSNFDLPTNAGVGYSLSTSVDPGYIDLVVGTSGPTNLLWDKLPGSTGDGSTWANSIAAPDPGQNWNNNGTPSGFTSGDAVTFSDVNAGNYNVNIASNVQPSSITVNSAFTYNFSSSGFVIQDYNAATPTTLTQSGGGLLNISNVNTFTGATNISGSGTTLHLMGTGTLASTSLTVGTGSTANIDGLLTGTPSVVDSGSITFGAANNSTNNLTGGYLVRTLSSLTVNSGASLAVAPATTVATRTVLVTSLASNLGKIDLSSNDMILRNANDGTVTTAGSVANELAAGYNNGAWNGSTGISSSAATTASRHLTALGYAPGGATFDGVSTSSNDVLVKYTYYGDANLDGKVDGSDYSRIDNGYLSHLTGWTNGDFNYDGVVNGSDYTLMDNAFNSQGAQFTAEIAAADAVPSAQIAGSPAASAVPEPASLGLLAMSAVGLLGRRRRHN